MMYTRLVFFFCQSIKLTDNQTVDVDVSIGMYAMCACLHVCVRARVGIQESHGGWDGRLVVIVILILVYCC